MSDIEQHPDYERVRGIWDGALKVAELAARKDAAYIASLEAQLEEVRNKRDRLSAQVDRFADQVLGLQKALKHAEGVRELVSRERDRLHAQVGSLMARP